MRISWNSLENLTLFFSTLDVFLTNIVFWFRDYGRAPKRWKWSARCEWFINTSTCRSRPPSSSTRPRICSRRRVTVFDYRKAHRYNSTKTDMSFAIGTRMHTRDGLQLRGWYHWWTRFVCLRAGNNNVQSPLECHTKFRGCPNSRRYCLPRAETHLAGHRTGESVISFPLFFFL